MIKTPKGAPAEVKRVIEQFNHFLENLTTDQIGYETYGSAEEHLDFLKTVGFSAYQADDEWFIGSVFEESYSIFYRDNQWWTRRCYDGQDSKIEHGAREVIADLKCSITA